MKNFKLHVTVIVLVIIAEAIGAIPIPIGKVSIVLLPMLFALIIGIFLSPKFLNLVNEKDMSDAGSLINLTLLLLMAKYGCNIGPTLPKIVKASPALILQELGNLGTVILGVPFAIWLGLDRQSVGAAHSIAREPNIAIVSDRYGLDSPEGQGVLGVYIFGTIFGTIFMSLLVSILDAFTKLHPYSLAMATGVGSASMMTAGVGSLVANHPNMEEMLTAFGAASNMLSGLDGVYVSLFLAIPFSEWLYRRMRGKKAKAPSIPPQMVGEEEKKKLDINQVTGGNYTLFQSFLFLLLTAFITLIGNTITSTHTDEFIFLDAIPGLLVLVGIAMIGLWLAKVIPGNLSSVAYIVTLAVILTVPAVPTSQFITPLVTKVDFLALCTPILAYAGIYTGRNLDSLKHSGWRLAIVSILVMIGTYLFSALIAQGILAVTGQI